MLRLLFSSMLLAFFYFTLGNGTVAAQGLDQVTGCLSAKGAIKDLAIGDAPAKRDRLAGAIGKILDAKHVVHGREW